MSLYLLKFYFYFWNSTYTNQLTPPQKHTYTPIFSNFYFNMVILVFIFSMLSSSWSSLYVQADLADSYSDWGAFLINSCKPHEYLNPAENARNSAVETISWSLRGTLTCHHMIIKTVCYAEQGQRWSWSFIEQRCWCFGTHKNPITLFLCLSQL